mmetsp:Transcript_15683/g.39864  ORF Transcript_15683/g.39864 Transcript_15683/m.39864 type:complete len:101 (+) Transcript_15683:601-903(+)
MPPRETKRGLTAMWNMGPECLCKRRGEYTKPKTGAASLRKSRLFFFFFLLSSFFFLLSSQHKTQRYNDIDRHKSQAVSSHIGIKISLFPQDKKQYSYRRC